MEALGTNDCGTFLRDKCQVLFYSFAQSVITVAAVLRCVQVLCMGRLMSMLPWLPTNSWLLTSQMILCIDSTVIELQTSQGCCNAPCVIYMVDVPSIFSVACNKTHSVDNLERTLS